MTFILLALVVEAPLFIWLFFHDLGEIEHMRTEMFFLFIVVELVIAMSFRSLKHSIFKAPPHKWLLLAIFWEMVLAFGLIQIPALRETFGIRLPTFKDLATVTAISAVVLLSMEALKAVLRRQAAKKSTAF
jgi:Ca2+-transporting ATPase